MDAEQLWETTMDFNHRTLVQITLEDSAAADEIFTTLIFIADLFSIIQPAASTTFSILPFPDLSSTFTLTRNVSGAIPLYFPLEPFPLPAIIPATCVP